MQIEKRNDYLPATIEELTKFVLIGREKLVSVRAEIRAINKIGLAQEVREQKNIEAQDLASALLDAEVRIGELIKEMPKKKDKITDSSSGRTIGTKSLLPEGINKKQSHYFQTLADNKEVVEQVKAEAKENDDLPTRTEVLKKVAELKKEKRNEELKNRKIEMPDDVYQVVYADPPWEYTNSGFTMSAENQYPTMPTDKIKEIKIKTDNNAVCFLWVTNPLLPDGLEVLKAWGFEYKTNLVWTKSRHTAGFYVFGQHELLLIGVKGSLLPIGEKPKSIILGENKVHSKKPEEVYSIIETMYPGLKKIELFARSEKEGFESWGNQI